MNRDNNQDNRRDRRNERDQRPGRSTTPSQMPGFEGPPMTPPPGFFPQGPGMEGMPRTAPPNFIPQSPQMEGGPTGFGTPYRSERHMGQRDIRRCVNRFTYIWLINGNNFWFYPTFADRQFVQGFRWRRNRWEFDRINLNRIAFFRCF